MHAAIPFYACCFARSWPELGALSENLLEQNAVFTTRQFDTVNEFGPNEL
jgi:hypothetical protein